jgi:2-pyrone-4,6-dicarboxylate lactonase
MAPSQYESYSEINMALSDEKWICEPLRPAHEVSPPTFAMPPLTCDSHMHVFGPIEQYPAVPNPRYTTPEGSLDQYLALAQRIGIGRMVFVQASFYGADNRCILDAMGRMGERGRGVILLPDGATSADLDDFHRRGVRGIRVDVFKADRDGCTLEDVLARVKVLRRVAKDLGWHLEFYIPGRWVVKMLPVLREIDVDFSIDHMGYMTEEEGLGENEFRELLELTRHERCWVKLTGSYRVDKDVSLQRTDWMGRELVAAAPDRMLWGTDWPHIPHCGRDTGNLLPRFESWAADVKTRNKILADNPARFYDFA